MAVNDRLVEAQIHQQEKVPHIAVGVGEILLPHLDAIEVFSVR